MQENWHIVDNNHNNKVNDRLLEGPQRSQIFIKRRSCSAGRQGCYLKYSIHPPKAHQPPHWQGRLSPSLSQPSVCLYKIIAILAVFWDWTKEQVGCEVSGCFSNCFPLFPMLGRRGSSGLCEWAAAGTRWQRGLRNTPWVLTFPGTLLP